jgi:sulfate adenylyltransferase subunit 1
LLEHLGALDPAGDVRGEPLRLSVQWVIRPQSDAHHDYRGLAGRVLSGAIVAGDTVEAVHSGARTRVARIERSGRDVTAAARGASVVVHLDDDLDVGRGALLVDPGSPVRQDRAIEADLAWFSRRPGLPGSRWLLAHGATTTRAHLREIAFTTDVRDGSRVAAAAVEENGIARVKIEAASPLAWEPYATRRSLGAAILIDEATNETAGALMLR